MTEHSDATQLVLAFGWTPRQLLTPDEIYENVDESLLRDLREDRRLEYKSAEYNLRELGNYFSMWANTHPAGGVIVLGIRQDTQFEGCSHLTGNRLNEIEKVADTYCPDAESTSKRVPIHRDKDHGTDFVVVFRVRYHPTKVVRTTAGKAFVRRGDSMREVPATEVRLLQADKGEVSFETEACRLKYPVDLRMDLVNGFVATVRRKKGWSEDHTVEDILSLMHLGVRDGGGFVPNVACALLFARDVRMVVPGCRIRFLRFEGEHEGTGVKWNAVKDEFVDGTIPEQIQRTEEILRSQLRLFSRLGKHGRFLTSPEYPDVAWYEAVVNACVHRSYGNGMNNMSIFVKMFDDRVVVESPGPFPPFVTSDNLYEMHVPRNPFLMDAMYYLDLVRCAHEGTRRMRDEMLGVELPAPEFGQQEVGHTLVRVTLRNNIKQRKVWIDSEVIEMLSAQLAHSLSEEEKRCINFCAENGDISVSDAQRLTTMTWKTARKLLDGLVSRGILSHIHRKDLVRDPAARFRLNTQVAQPTSSGK